MNPSAHDSSSSTPTPPPPTTIVNPLAVGQILSFSDLQTNKMVHVKIVPPLPPASSTTAATNNVVATPPPLPASLILNGPPAVAEQSTTSSHTPTGDTHNNKLVVNLNSTKIVIRNLNTKETPDSLLAVSPLLSQTLVPVRQPRMLKSAANTEKAVQQLRKLNASTTIDSLDVVPMDLEFEPAPTVNPNGGRRAIVDAMETADDEYLSDAEIEQTVPQQQPEIQQQTRTSTPKTNREFKALQKMLTSSKVLCNMVQSGAEGGARKARKSTPVLGGNGKASAAATSSTAMADAAIDDSKETPMSGRDRSRSAYRSSPTVIAPAAQSTPLGGDVEKQPISSSSSSTEEKSRRQMRSQNAEFSAKQQRFLLGIQRDEQRDSIESDSEIMGSDSEETVAGRADAVDESSTVVDNNRSGGGSEVSSAAVLDETATASQCELANDAVTDAATEGSTTLLRAESDHSCWLCHMPGATMPCVDCSRSRHTNEHVCSRVRLIPAGDRWRCMECVNELEAKRNAKAAKYTLDGLGPMLRFAIKRCMQIVGSKAFPFGPAIAGNSAGVEAPYIANPMSFSILRANVDAHRYTTTGAFTSDVKWFMHNCIVSGYKTNSRQVSIVRQILKTCKQEMYDIETCPECYYNANTHKENWFVEVCGQRPHILLWAKLKGFPYWPAKAMGLNATASAVDVRFFGEHDRAWVPIKDCFVFSEKEPNPPTKKLSRMNSFHDCLKEVDVYIQKIKQKFGHFTYAPERCAYDPDREDEQLEMLIPNIRLYLATQRSLTYRIVKTANNSMSIIKSSADSPSPKQPTAMASTADGSPSSSASPAKAVDPVLTVNMQPRVQLYSSEVVRHETSAEVTTPKATKSDDDVSDSPPNDKDDVVPSNTLKRTSSTDDAKRVPKKRVRSTTDEMTTVGNDKPDVGAKAKKRHRAKSLELESDGEKQEKAKHNSSDNVSTEVSSVETETIATSVSESTAVLVETEEIVDTSTNQSTTNSNNEKSITDPPSDEPLIVVPPTPLAQPTLNGDPEASSTTIATIPPTTTPSNPPSSSQALETAQSQDGAADVPPTIDVVVKQEMPDNDIDTSSNQSSMNMSDTSLMMLIKREWHFEDEVPAEHPDDVYINRREELPNGADVTTTAADSSTVLALEQQQHQQQQQQQQRGNISVKDLNELKSPVLVGERRVGQSTTLRCFAKKDKSSRKYITTPRTNPINPDVRPPPPGPRSSKIVPQQRKHAYQQGMMTFNGRNMVYIPLPDDLRQMTTQSAGASFINDLPIIAISRPSTTTTTTTTTHSSNSAASTTTTATSTATSKSTPPPLASVSLGPLAMQYVPANTRVYIRSPTPTSASVVQPLSSQRSTLSTSCPPPLTLSAAGAHALMPPLLPPLASTTAAAVSLPPLTTTTAPTNPSPINNSTPAPNNATTTSSTQSDNLPTHTANTSTTGTADGGHMLSGFVSENLAAAVTDTIARGMPRLYAKPSGPLRSDGTTPFTSEAGPISQMLLHNAHKLADFFRSVIEDTLADMSGLAGPSSTAPQCPEARIKLLQLENERLRHAHAQELGQLRANTDRILVEMQKSMDNERQRVTNDVRRQAEAERLRAVEETKRKQWCVQCGREAQFFCCWNTSYCDYPCQQQHWVRHMPHCAQTVTTTTAAVTGAAPTPSETQQNGTACGEKSQSQVQQHVRVVAKTATSAVVGKAGSAGPAKQQQQHHPKELVLAQRMGNPPSGLRIAQAVQPRNSGSGAQRLNPAQSVCCSSNSSSNSNNNWRGGAIISTAPPHFQLLNNRQVNCVMVSSTVTPAAATFTNTTTTIANNMHTSKSTAAPGTSLLLNASPAASLVRIVTQPQPR